MLVPHFFQFCPMFSAPQGILIEFLEFFSYYQNTSLLLNSITSIRCLFHSFLFQVSFPLENVLSSLFRFFLSSNPV